MAADLRAVDEWLHRAARDGDTLSLVMAYAAAAELAEAGYDSDAAAFYRTHAYVWALVAGDDDAADRLGQALRRAGRL